MTDCGVRGADSAKSELLGNFRETRGSQDSRHRKYARWCLLNLHFRSCQKLVMMERDPEEEPSTEAPGLDSHELKMEVRGSLKPEIPKKSDMLYTVNEVPPWYTIIPISFQQYLTMFTSTVTAPYVMAPALCIPSNNPAKAYLLSTIMFVSGIATLLQTVLGVRLPIVQGSSAAFYTPMFAIMALPKWKCPDWVFNETMSGNYTDEIWHSRMREIQGCIAVASVLPIILSVTGAINILIKYITPLVVVPTITLIGLSLFDTGSDLSSGNWWVALGTIVIMLIFCLYLEKLTIPVPTYEPNKGFRIGWFPWFKFFPIISTISIMWLLCYVLTVTDALPVGDLARTDNKADMIDQSPWFRFPYPFQWGTPTVSVAGVFGMMAAVIASVIESVGDYYACARLSGAPNPPPHAMSRGILVEGLGCLCGGLWGTGSGVTSFADNIGAISITKIGSRRVIEVATIFMFLFGMVTKIGAIFVSIPDPVVGGMFIIMFGLITAVGISSVQYIDMNSSRNLCILGFSIFFGISLSRWVAENEDSIDTGNDTLDEIVLVLLETSMLVGGFTGFVLDNTVPGTEEERGLHLWRAGGQAKTFEESKASSECYDMPFGMSWMRKHKIFSYIPFCPTFQPCSLGCSCTPEQWDATAVPRCRKRTKLVSEEPSGAGLA